MQPPLRFIIGITLFCLAAGACRGQVDTAAASPPPPPPTPVVAAPLAGDWRTDFEKSGGTQTPRYKETIAYAARLAAASPAVHLTRFGTSPQGRDLPLLIVDKNGNFTPTAVRQSGNVVLLVQACVHAGESEGKDAGLLLIRDLLAKPALTGLLDHVTLLFLPIFNVDGHERFGPFNRINQNGPREMGWRTTARNLNLNRDFMKADAAEMRAWLGLFTSWLPDFTVDVHTTDGADYQYPLTYGLELFGNMDAGLTTWARGFIGDATHALGDAGIPMTSYVMFKKWHDPRSGLVAYASDPRFSLGYMAIQNRPGVLLETHMLKDYGTRVRATYAMLVQTLRQLGATHGELRAAVARADTRAAAPDFRATPLPLAFKTTEKATIVDFLGLSYTVEKSALTGGDWFRYSDKKETFKIPYFNDVVPTQTVALPRAYLIPPQWDDVIERLTLHGVTVRRLARDVSVRVRGYRFDNVTFSPGGWFEAAGRPFEGRQQAEFTTVAVDETRVFLAGTAVVETAQRTARVIGHLLEPAGPDSFVRWGFFNGIFQQTEYAESYVIERMAREMLAADPTLAAEFAAAKRRNPKLATDPAAVLDWFYERTPYFDKSTNLYPVGLVDDASTLDTLRAALSHGTLGGQSTPIDI
ncbi:MAG: M14 family metallopeptidase [Myxococcota bacterium]|nr:M14 family metallopeptidase [Myxococcota bacterium]